MMRASFKGRIDLGADRRRLEGTLALEPPDRLYVEILGPIGGPRAVMAAKGNRLVVLFPASREFVDEEATASTYEALIGLRLDTSSLIELIRFGRGGSCAVDRCEGKIPLAPDEHGVSRDLLVRREGDLLSARLSEDATMPCEFHGLELRLRETESFDAGQNAEELFVTLIPEGWTRLRPLAEGAVRNLLLTR